MKNRLILLTTKFPFGIGEEFIENEIPYLNKFDDIVIFSLEKKEHEEITRKIPVNIEVPYLKNKLDIKDTIKLAINLVGYLREAFFWNELYKIISSKGNYVQRLLRLFNFIFKSEIAYLKIIPIIKATKFNKNEKIVIYAYWLHIPAFIGTKLEGILAKNNKVTVYSRAHGFDLYEERDKVKYIPFQKYLLSKMNKVFTVSNDGENYIKNKYPYKTNITVNKLGTEDNGTKYVTKSPNNTFNIVSCSSLVQIKRVDLIIKSLSLIKNVDIKWYHLGDGPEFDKLKNEAMNTTLSNVNINWVGRLSNTEVINFYKNKDIHLFLNVSENEGIPVSIMEAISFSIPVIATDVGGNSEIVFDKVNGFLLDVNFSLENLKDKIIEFYTMENSDYQLFRKNSRAIWEEEYNSKCNYIEFVEMLMEKQ